MPKKKKSGPNNAGQATKVYDHQSNGEKCSTKGPVKCK